MLIKRANTAFIVVIVLFLLLANSPFVDSASSEEPWFSMITKKISQSFWWWPFSFVIYAVPGVSATALNTALKEGKRPILLVDVRSPAEFHGGHIQNAVNIPLGEIKGAEISKIVEKIAAEKGYNKADVEVVCICLSAHRSPPAVRLIQNADPALDVKQLDYGMANWWLNQFDTSKA